MEWRKVENSDSIKPSSIDMESSKVYVYMRKDFELIPAITEEGHERPEHWEYMEKRILKEDLEYYQLLTDHTNTISDIEDALIELAEIITEE